MHNASPWLGPWDTLFSAFRAVEPLFIENHVFSEPRRRVIASSPALQERETAKVRSLIAALTTALGERGIPENLANLAAQMGMAALGHAVRSWFDDPAGDPGNLDAHIVRAFQEVRDLSSSSLEPIKVHS